MGIMDQRIAGQGSQEGNHGSIRLELEKETSICFENVCSVVITGEKSGSTKTPVSDKIFNK